MSSGRNIARTVFVEARRGMAGSAIVRRLQALGYANILVAERDQLDLTSQADVQAFFAQPAYRPCGAGGCPGGMHPYLQHLPNSSTRT